MITPGMARSLTPTAFVERSEAAPRRRHAPSHVVAARQALRRVAHTLRHPRLRHVAP